MLVKKSVNRRAALWGRHRNGVVQLADREQIKKAIEKGIAWLKTKQKADGSYGNWGLGSTGLAVMALLEGGIPRSDPAVLNAVRHILNSTPPDATYFRALTVMALVANNEKTPAILGRVRSDTEWLVRAQGSSPSDTMSCGGWSKSGRGETADGSNTHFALLALHAAASWGLEVPRETWAGALAWYQKNYGVNQNGSFVYCLGDSSHLDNRVVSHAITAGALSSLAIISTHSPEPEVKSRARELMDSTLSWLESNFTAGMPPGARDSWHFYYLLSLQRACAMAPGIAFPAASRWYAAMAGWLVKEQKPGGNWASKNDKKSTEVIYTAFALLALTGIARHEQQAAGGAAGGGGEGSGHGGPGAGGKKRPHILPVALLAAGVALCCLLVFALAKGSGQPPPVGEQSPESLAGGECKIMPAAAEVYGRVSGPVEEILVSPGNWVSAGQVLLTIDPREVEFELSQVDWEIRKLQAKINALSRLVEFNITSRKAGEVAAVHVQPGSRVGPGSALVTLLSGDVLDVSLPRDRLDNRYLEEGLPVDLYLPEGKTVTGFISSPPGGTNSGGGGEVKFTVEVQKETDRALKEASGESPGDGPGTAPGGGIQQPRVVIHTAPGPLEAACRVEKGQEVPVYPSREGRLDQVYVTPGDTVTAGRPVARARDDRVLLELEMAQIELEKLRQARQNLQELAQDYQVLSPAGGKVAAVYVEEGTVVRPDTLMALIEQPGHFQALVPLESGEFALIRPGYPARVTVHGSGGEEAGQFEGRVAGLARDAGGSGETVAVVVFDRQPELAPGMPARVEIKAGD